MKTIISVVTALVFLFAFSTVFSQQTLDYSIQVIDGNGIKSYTMTIAQSNNDLGIKMAMEGHSKLSTPMYSYMTAGSDSFSVFSKGDNYALKGPVDNTSEPARLQNSSQKKVIRGVECELYKGYSSEGFFEFWVDSSVNLELWKFPGLAKEAFLGSLLVSQINGIIVEGTITQGNGTKKEIRLLNQMSSIRSQSAVTLPAGVRELTTDQYVQELYSSESNKK